ncbi:hypothetical protein A3844_07660 [Paenibacillus helianthi]|uniref:DUF4013 domain-containing protein n=1 Tax=Paenibacillus helianthi TaxID=1349432 RepID=A0ABX3ERA1_9BACL|nr:hypothetical protein [Paenibacillus helianthi]OKP88565.1 hypothetical protein A3844_07660 [Paenibacillus helianthi]
MQKLNQVLVSTGVESFREIVPITLLSLASSAMLVPVVIFTPMALAFILIPLLYMPLFYGVFYAYHRRTEGKKLSVKEMLSGARKGFVPAVVFGLFCSLLVLVLGSTWWFYGGRDGVVNWTIAIFQTYFVAMAFVSQFYTLELVLQNKLGIFKAMGESVKLFLRYPAYTIGAFFQALVVGVMLVVTVVGFASLFNGMLAVYLHKAAYNVLHPDEDAGADGVPETNAAYAEGRLI